jgi:hypothetical protein
MSENIDGEAAYDLLGLSSLDEFMSTSDDGTTVAIGGPSNAGNDNDSGHVRVFSFE